MTAPSSPLQAPPVSHISSRDNPGLKALRRLSQDSTAYRKQGQVWLEGDHLCRAALARGVVPLQAVFSASYWALAQAQWAQSAIKITVLTDALFADISALDSPAAMGFVIGLPSATGLQPGLASVILDRVQDAGNVGSILRSASAFGFQQVIALQGTAGLWSPKVLRSGMGAHFGLRLVESASLADLDDLGLPIIVTSSHQGELIQAAALPQACAWAFGHEGQGVSSDLIALAERRVRIDQPGGEESLNVAAAAAICLHASVCARTIGNGGG